MKYVRLLFFSIIILFLFITIISLFIPSHVKMSRTIDLKADRQALMRQLSQPANWRQWYPGLDSARAIYHGEAITGWAFKKGDAKIRLTTVTDDEVQAEFSAKKIKPVLNVWKIIPYSNGDSATVLWYCGFRLRWYPWEKFASLLLERTYGPKMEQGLMSLKQIVEIRGADSQLPAPQQ